MIQYEGRDSKYNVMANRSDINQMMSFARYQSISSRSSSTASRLNDNASMEMVRDRGRPRITNVDGTARNKRMDQFRIDYNVRSMGSVAASRKRRLDHIEASICSKRARISDDRAYILQKGEMIKKEAADEVDEVDLWSVSDVVEWFQQNGFMEEKDLLIRMFYKLNIDGRKFMRLTSKDLLKLGFLDDREQILYIRDNQFNV